MSNILLYLSGAFVSFIVIVSGFSVSVISIVPRSIIPFSPVVFVSVSLPGSVTSNSAPCSFIVWSFLSTFSSCTW